MSPEAKEEKKEEVIYRADPFTFIFRELDLLRTEFREFKAETKEEFALVRKEFKEEFININKRLDAFIIDTNQRFESVNKRFDDINKRFERLYIIVIMNLIGIVAFLIKTFFF